MVGTAYVLSTHKGPAQVGRLVAALQPAPVYLHVDLATPRKVASSICAAAAAAASVEFVPRVRTGWASWGQVVAAVRGAEMAARDGAAHVVHMTGQDYPLRSSADIDTFLAGFPGQSFIAWSPVPSPILGADGGVGRFREWHLPIRGKRAHIPVRRSIPAGLTPHWNQAQWCISSSLALQLASDLRERPDLVRYFRRVWMPDESFVATMAYSHRAESVINENLWFVRWPADSSHPDVLGAADVDELRIASARGSEMGGASRVKLFARKFDIEGDQHVLDLLDAVRTTPRASPRPSPA